MSPPIDIDGSEIQRATIDGEDVSEITIDGQQTARFVDIPDSGVAQWEFEQDVTDSWFDNDLTDNTSAGYASALASYGSNSKDFDGVNDYLVADTPVINTQSGVAQSVIGWVQLDSASDDYRIINQNDDTNGFRIIYSNGRDAIGFAVEDSGTIVNIDYNNPSTGTPIHFGWTKDASDNITVYIDASVINTDTGASGSEPFNTHFASYDGTNQFGDIKLDHVTVLDKEATQTEVQNHKDTGSIDG